MPKIIQNAVMVPEKDLYLVSTDPHTSVSVTLDDGLVLTIRGGTEFATREDDYIKLFCANRYVEYTLTDEDSFQTVAHAALGRSDETGEWRAVKDLPTDQLQRIVDEPVYQGTIQREVAAKWLNERSKQNMSV